MPLRFVVDKSVEKPTQSDDAARFLDVLTVEENAPLDVLLALVADLKEKVWAREPYLRPASAPTPRTPTSV